MPPIDDTSELETRRLRSQTIPSAGALPGDDEPDDEDDELERRVARGQPVQLGRYVLLRKLGEGGMSLVFVAYDERLDRRVALKLLRASSRHGAEDRRLIQREAQALARLSHPNVVQVYDVVELGERLFLTMELVPGQTLRAWMDERPRPWPQVLEMFRQVGAGLLAAHRHGLVHRDLKPANVLVDAEGRVRVADFGLARVGHGMSTTLHGSDELSLEDEPSHESLLGEPLTMVGKVMGTPAYMATEQARGEAVDARTDQFSFCVMLYEALYGRRPFAGRTQRELAINVAEGNVLPATTRTGLRPVPPWLHQAVVRGLRPAPEQRWPDMESLLEVLAHDPARTRQRWLWAGSTLGLSGIAVATTLLAHTSLAAPCTGFSGRLGGVWDDATRDRTEAAIVGTELPFAADSWQRVRPELDAYADDWVAARTAVCEAYQRGELSHADHDRRLVCLERGHGHLQALTSTLGEGDPVVVERAVAAAAQLPRLDECGDLRALEQQIAPPEDDAQAERVEQLRRRLAQAVTTAQLGRHAQGRVLSQQVVEDARAVGHAPLLAEALLVQGKIEDLDGDYEAALATVDEAVWVARTAGHDRVEGDAAAVMMMVLGDRQARFGDAEVWRKHALAVLARRPDDRPLQAAIELRLGSLALGRGALDEALQHYERSLAIEEERVGRDGFRVAAVLANMATVLKDQGRYAEALEVNDRALAIRTRHLGPEHPEVAMSLHTRGIILENRGDFDDAIASYRQSLRLLERSLGPDHMRVAYPRFGLATTLHYTGHHEEALAEFQQSLRSLLAHLGPEHPHVATAHNNIGLVLHALGRHAQALDAFTRARDLSTARLGAEHADVARAEGNRGMALVALGQLPRAQQAYERARVIYEAALGPDHQDLGYPLTGLGEVAIRQGRPRDAVPWLERAIALRQDVPATERAVSRQLLAQALWDGEIDRKRAIEVAREAEAIAAAGGEGAQEVLGELRQWLRTRARP